MKTENDTRLEFELGLVLEGFSYNILLGPVDTRFNKPLFGIRAFSLSSSNNKEEGHETLLLSQLLSDLLSEEPYYLEEIIEKEMERKEL